MAIKTTNDDLGSILEAFKPALHSIDLRTIAIRPQGEEWQNLITTMCISEKTLSKVTIDQAKVPHIRNEEFEIFFQSVPPKDFTAIFDQIKQGNLNFRSVKRISKVKTRSLDLLTLKVQSNQFGNFGGNFGLQKWTIFATASADYPQERNKLWSIIDNQNQVLRLQGFRNMIELLHDVFKITFTQSRDSTDFVIIIPPIAQICTAKFCGKSFEVKVTKPNNIKGLQLNLLLKKSGTNPPDIVWKKQIPIKKKENVFHPHKMVPFDSLEVNLIHTISALTLDYKDVPVPLENTVEPLLRTLKGFLPLQEFKRMLLEPSQCGDDPSEVFETAVAWLLSMAGFVTLHLGIKVKTIKGICQQTDRLKLENEYQVGAADIIAYKDNETLYLIDCDLKGNDNKKIQDLIELQKHFQSTFSEYNHLRVVPVLCSPRDLNEISREGLVLFGDYRINQMLEHVLRGDTEQARSTLRWLV